eukprot:TRINITY_DN8470_c0_g1_i2.p1 TRINITY_DN8470_c0_g1~~TRINITY_DN8470_c0_g1_i2.p1  ORF type:complete len:234 (-),score=62.78 TRINITY_DN8470_c0_g1_i2:61-762(-)
MKHEGIGGVTRFVIMNNVFNTPYDPVEKYDLKGSTLGRSVPEKKRKEGVILKDLDIKQMDRKLYLPEDLKDKFVRQLKKDTDFLAAYKVMDYSLLLGVYYKTPTNRKKVAQNKAKLEASQSIIPTLFQNSFQKKNSGIQVTRPDGTKEIYFIGIIDVLIQYVTRKKAEHLFKAIAYAGEEASVVDPKYYSKRFFKFICDLVPNSDELRKNVEAESEEEYGPAKSGPAKVITVM